MLDFTGFLSENTACSFKWSPRRFNRYRCGDTENIFYNGYSTWVPSVFFDTPKIEANKNLIEPNHQQINHNGNLINENKKRLSNAVVIDNSR